VQNYSRHKNLQTMLRYDDNRKDQAGELARRLAEDAEGPPQDPAG
jgi:hypothetical protein